MWFLAACAPVWVPSGSVPTDTGGSAAPSPPPTSSSTPTAPTAPTEPTAPTAPESFAVLSLNLHCLKLDGTPYATNAERFAAIAAEVAASDVRAVAAQEVCVGAEDARDLFAQALRDATGVEWSSAWAFAHVGWEGTPDQADEGVAVFAREPLGAVRELAYASPGTLRRVGLQAELTGGPSLATVHLDFDDPAAREDQARQTAAFAPVWGLDAVVAGDLNDRAGSATHAAFGAMGFDDATAALDPERIDHLFVHGGAGWVAVEARTVLTDPAVSDHPGIVVVLEPREPPAFGVTRFVAEVDVGFGSWLAVRGDGGALSWDRGWWAVPTGSAQWELVVPSPAAPFAYKAVRDDVDWEQGADHAGEPGVEQRWTPAF